MKVAYLVEQEYYVCRNSLKEKNDSKNFIAKLVVKPEKKAGRGSIAVYMQLYDSNTNRLTDETKKVSIAQIICRWDSVTKKKIPLDKDPEFEKMSNFDAILPKMKKAYLSNPSLFEEVISSLCEAE